MRGEHLCAAPPSFLDAAVRDVQTVSLADAVVGVADVLRARASRITPG